MDKFMILWFAFLAWISVTCGRHFESSHGMPGIQYKVEAIEDDIFLREPDIYKFETLDTLKTRHARSTSFRQGDATTTHSCENIRGVPSEFRDAEYYKPSGLDEFYQKYTEAYGIPVVASANVSDDALKRTCYVVRHMFSGKKEIRSSFYKRYGRVAIIGAEEETTDIPEYSCYPSSMNDRSRGLGATDSIPVSSAGEENILCYCDEKYFLEDIIVHEVAHGIHLLGARYAIDGWEQRLKENFDVVKLKGLWKDTYSMTNHVEYFAEGVQSYFNTNEHHDEANGIHGPVSTGARLKEYDPVLYQLIQEVFPCNNKYIRRCESSREEELQQNLKMDCPTIEPYTDLDAPEKGGIGFGSSVTCLGDCTDKNTMCAMWAVIGECEKNPGYMFHNCEVSCEICVSSEDPVCEDGNDKCLEWAQSGECAKNPGYMLVNCMKSCDECSDSKVERKRNPSKRSLAEYVGKLESPRVLTNVETMENLDKRTSREAHDLVKRSDAVCEDKSGMCPCWALGGECNRNPSWMYYNCQLSCKTCPPTTTDENCKDSHEQCHFWALLEECEKNPDYMLHNCKRSCKVC